MKPGPRELEALMTLILSIEAGFRGIHDERTRLTFQLSACMSVFINGVIEVRQHDNARGIEILREAAKQLDLLAFAPDAEAMKLAAESISVAKIEH